MREATYVEPVSLAIEQEQTEHDTAMGRGWDGGKILKTFSN
jgi:hypothetical protein